MVIVDSSVWIDFFNHAVGPEADWLDRALGTQPLAITDLILCEVLQGIRNDADFNLVRNSLSKLMVFPGNERLSVDSAQNYRLLRARGITLRKTIDCLIATFCLTNNHYLLHRDRDFDPFERHLGLKVIHPHS